MPWEFVVYAGREAAGVADHHRVVALVGLARGAVGVETHYYVGGLEEEEIFVANMMLMVAYS